MPVQSRWRTNRASWRSFTIQLPMQRICDVVVSRFTLVEHNLLALLPGGDKVFGGGASHDPRRSKIHVINVVIIHMLNISPHCHTYSCVDDSIPPSLKAACLISRERQGWRTCFLPIHLHQCPASVSIYRTTCVSNEPISYNLLPTIYSLSCWHTTIITCVSIRQHPISIPPYHLPEKQLTVSSIMLHHHSMMKILT